MDEKVVNHGFELRSVPDVTLARGRHGRPEHGLCLMELVAWIAGEKHSDRPICACPTLTAYGRRLNDLMPGEWRDELLLHIAPMLVGTVDLVGQHKRAERLVMTLIGEILPLHLKTEAVAKYVSLCKSAGSLAEAQGAALLAWNAAHIATINVPTGYVSGLATVMAGRVRPKQRELMRDAGENGTTARVCKLAADAAALALALKPEDAVVLCAEALAIIGGFSEPLDGPPLYWSNYPERKRVWVTAARALRESISLGRRDPTGEGRRYWTPQFPNIPPSVLAADPRPGEPRRGSQQWHRPDVDQEVEQLRNEAQEFMASAIERSLINDGRLVYSKDAVDEPRQMILSAPARTKKEARRKIAEPPQHGGL